MADLTAQRTLVKSPPELWTELSEVESLAKHLGELGEIRITKVEPESTVAWEGEEVSGTVELEQSGWGTKVTFTATVPEPDPAAPEAEPEPIPEPVAVDPQPVTVEPVTVEPVTVEPVAAEPVAVGPVAVEPERVAEPKPAAEPKRRNFLARWLFRPRAAPEPVAADPTRQVADPDPVVPEPVVPEPVVLEPVPEPVVLEPVEPEPVAAAEPVVEPEPVADPDPSVPTTDAERVQAVLDGTLDALGQAHHRPFSRG